MPSLTQCRTPTCPMLRLWLPCWSSRSCASHKNLTISRIATFIPNMYQTFITTTPGIINFLNTGGSSNVIHGSLQNAIYLWAVHFTGGNNANTATTFLRYSQTYITQGLQVVDGNTILDILQANTLLGLYLLIIGKASESTYHVSTAVSLAINSELHQLSRSSSGGRSPIGVCYTPDVLATRVEVWWNVYYLDKLWSLVTGKAPNVLDSDQPTFRVTTPWLNSSRVYAQVSLVYCLHHSC
jgi:hypothetical protein